MSEPISTSVTARARFTSLGVTYTPSPAPTCTVYLYVGSPTTRATVVSAQATFSEGGSTFAYTLASGSNTAVGMLEFVFTTSDIAVDNASLSAWVEIVAASTTPPTAAAIAAAVWDYLTSAMTTANSIGAWLLLQLGKIGSANATVLTPFTASGDLIIFAGADYYAADGNNAIFTVARPEDLTGGTVVLKVGIVVFACTFTGSVGAWVITPTPLPRADTATLTIGNAQTYQLQATLAGGHKPAPLAAGNASVKSML